VRWATSASLADARTLPAVHALTDRDLTAKVELDGLPADQQIVYEVSFVDLHDGRAVGAPARGSFRTPPNTRRNLRFLWSGDTVGQGWGINPDIGGMRIYDTMLATDPDFFINSGDTIYADGPLQAQVELPDGSLWRNLVTEAKSKVAETLDEYRGQYRYNLLDEPHRRFHARVPVFAQWDDHEVTNNWYPGKRLDGDSRYTETSVDLLAARAMRAFQDYQPVRHHPLDPERLFDRFTWGPALEVFRLDLRSYRGANSDEQPTIASAETAILGSRQLAWLKAALAASTATWKIIACDMPLGVVIPDDFRTGRGAEGIALRDGMPAGRELEIAELLTFIRDRDIRNLVWLTADVHYTAAHYYDPGRARYDRFAPFWEFVSGPLNAGTFGPNGLDDTFGPQLVYQRVPPAGQVNLSPAAGMQFFGQVDLDGATDVLTVRLKDAAGATLFTQRIEPDLS
jgi:alkaline phosphatase D